MAERGRSLGIILIGAQQTASEVERRVVANSADPGGGPARLRRGRPGRVRLPAAGPAPAGHHRQARHDAGVPARAAHPAGASSSRSRPGPPGPARAGGCAGPTADRATTRSRASREVAPCGCCTPPTGTSARPSGAGPGRRAPGRAGRDRRHRRARGVDLVIVAGDLFDTGRAHRRGRAHRVPGAARPGRRRRRRWWSSPATTTRPSGWRRWRRCRRPAGSTWPRPSARRATAGCSEVEAGGDTARMALLPFLSQRYVVTADCCARTRGRRPRRLRRPGGPHPRGADGRVPRRHGQPRGRPPDGHGRDAWGAASGAPTPCSTTGCRPPRVPADRALRGARPPAPGPDLPGPAPLHYCGSPLQLDFGETANQPVVNVVDVRPGRPAEVTAVPLTAGRRLRTVRGTLVDVLAAAWQEARGGDHLRVVLDEPARAGLADEVRERLPDAVEVVLARDERRAPTPVEPRPARPYPPGAVRRVPGRAGRGRRPGGRRCSTSWSTSWWRGP